MAWWEDEKPSASRLADQLADSSRPTQPASPYADDRSGSWAVLPLWLLLGAAITAGGVALLVSMRSATGVCLGTTVLALGLFYLSQYGVLAGYVLQVGRLRRRRVEAALAHQPPPALTDHDVRQFHVPIRPSYAGSAFVGFLDPGDAPAPAGLRAARVVGGVCSAVFVVGLVATLVVGAVTRA